MKRLLPILVLALSVFACTHTTRPYLGTAAPPGPRPERPEVTFRVGTARVDVTPPPTAASFGHAPDAHLMEGFWTRLYCRVFVFESGTGPEDSIAFVPCELPAPSNILQRTVAEDVHTVDPARKLDFLFPASRIMMTMTHTHAGPAHYLESPAYGGATSSRFPGFDPKMVEFLAERIAKGIVDAYTRRVPARLRWVHDDVWDLTRNRSIDAYRLNTRHPYSPAAPDPSAPDEYRAIDPALDILQIEADEDARPLGWMVFFAMHPTVLPASNRLFGGDAFGVASRALERELRRTLVGAKDADPLVALIQTNEGDISPRYTMPTVEETERVGGALADRAIVASQKAGSAPFRTQVTLDARYVEVDMDKLFTTEGLCQPVLGQAATRGGSDHHATIDGLLQDAPDSDMTDPCAPKRKGLGVLQNVIVPAEGFPKHVALALVRLDTTLVSFLPAELTITAGHVLDDAVRQDGPHAERWLVAGLANAYLQYVTTADEYQLQAYEGGSNLYGPRTLGIFEKRLRVLARSLKGEPGATFPDGENAIDGVSEVRFETATERPRFARPGLTPSLQEIGAARKNRVLCRLPGRKPVALCDIWEDGGPGSVPMTDQPWIAIVTEKNPKSPARVCGAPFGKERLAPSCDPGATLDDRGTSFRTRTRGQSCCSDSKTWMWTSLITPTASDWEALAPQGSLRFSARGGADGDVMSPTFSAAELPPECDYEQTRYCLAEAPPECLSTPSVKPR